MSFNASGGSEAMTIASGGNVGIGATGPVSKLDVAGGARVGADAVCNDAKAGMLAWNSSTLQVCVSTATGFVSVASASTSPSQWLNGASSAIYYNAGNVGIGTTSPGAKLEVNDGSGWTRSSGGSLSVGYTTGQPRVLISRDVLGSGGAVLLSQSGEAITQYGAGIGIPAQRSLALITSDGTALVERMRVDPSGNVGIGTTSPSQKLEVKGNALVYDSTATTGTTNLSVRAGAGQGSANVFSVLQDTGAAGVVVGPSGRELATLGCLDVGNGNLGCGAQLSVENGTPARVAALIKGTGSQTADIFQVQSSAASTLFNVSATGNVGIGTTTPNASALLDVYSTTKGFLPPRVTTTQRDAISSPATGLTVYNTTTNALNVYGASSWGAVGSGGGALSTLTDVTLSSPANSQVLAYNGSAWVNSNVGSVVAGVAGPSFSVNKAGTNQTGMASWTKLTWSTEDFDTNNNFASSKFTPTVAGKYIVNVQVNCPSAPTCAAAVWKNGAEVREVPMYATANQAPNVTVIVDMNGSSDYLEAYGYSSDGTASGGANLTNFSGSMLAPLASGVVAGTGSAGYVPYWTSGNALSYDSTSGGQYYWDSTNHRLGIGTASPATLLQAYSTGTTIMSANSDVGQGSSFRLYSAGADKGEINYWGASTGNGRANNLEFINLSAAGADTFWTNSAERMRISASGDVNVGSSTSAGDTLRYFDLQNSDTGSSAGAIMRFITSNAAGSGNTTVDMVKYKNGNFVINNNDTGAITSFGTGGSERLRIDGSGRVGIGTTSPTLALLQTSGQIGNTSAIFGSNTTGVSLIAADPIIGFNTYYNAGFKAIATGGASYIDGGGAVFSFANAPSVSGQGTAQTFTTRMTIDTSGNVGIGNTTPNGKLEVASNIVGNGVLDGIVMYQQADNTNTIQTYIDGQWANRVSYAGGCCNMLLLNPDIGNVAIGTTANNGYKLDVNGTVRVSGNITTSGGAVFATNGDVFLAFAGGWLSSYISWSDERLKTAVEALPEQDGLAAIMKLRPVTFRWKDPKKDASEGRQVGFIAQDVEKLFPGLVRSSEKPIEVDTATGKQTIKDARTLNYQAMVAPVVKAVQELKADNDNQTAEIEELRREIQALKAAR